MKVLVGVMILLLLVPEALAQTRSSVDSTQDLLNQIDTAPPGVSLQAHQPTPFFHLFAPLLATAAALGIAASIGGTFVLLRREALVALAIPQVVAIGAAIGLRLGWPTLPPALLMVTVAVAYLVISRRRGIGYWLLPSLYVAGLSLSFLIIAHHGQDVADLQNLFVGIDVAVTPERAMLAVPILVTAAAACALLWRRWLLLAQAPSAAELAGLNPARWDAFFLSLLTLILLLGTDSLGVVMVLAMLFLPAAAVLPWARRIPAALVGSAFLSLLFLALGFYFSNTQNWPLSQSVGAIGFTVVLLSHAVHSSSLIRFR
jgi:ABC-type Mn2+/Zn2+ transport system permease subunit